MIKETPLNKRGDFSEVVQHPSTEELITHAASSNNSCKSECQANCPLGVNIPGVLNHVKRKEFQQARDLIDQENPFPSFCGRFCNAPCQQSCSCAKHFKTVERYLGDNYEPTQTKVKQTKQKVAVVGGGIAGLTVATMLRRNGILVKIIEATEKPGGLLARSTPEFRLPSKVVNHEVGGLASHVEVCTHTIGGAMNPLEELSSKLDAVVVATGANKPSFLGITGEHLPNVHTAVDYLAGGRKKTKERTVVIGATDQAIDAARCARRLGDDVTVLFHKDVLSMPSSDLNLRHAQQEGVRFMLLTRPTRIHGNHKATSIECVQMMLAESDLDDTKVAVPIENSEFFMDCDKIIIGVGMEPNPTMGRYSPLRTVGKGRVWTNENHQTTIPNVFAAGEIAIGSSSVEKTILHAKACARDVKRFLDGEIEETEGQL